MKIGLCAGLEKLSGLPLEGLDYLEPTVGDLLCPQKDEQAFTQRLQVARTLHLPTPAVNVFIPGELRTTGPAVESGAVDRFVDTAFRRAARAGVRIVVFGSAGSRKVPEGFDPAAAFEQLVGHLKRWGPMAGACGVTVAVEALQKRECNIINSLTEGAELVRRAGHPAVRMLADTYHMASDGEGPESIRQFADLLVHAHCADPAGRVPLGLGPADHRPYFRALKDIGYDGGVSIEAHRWSDFAAQLPAAVAALREQIDSA
ncbi:MAG: sugar phosphate isomerase/epimerase [Phycisphaerae bacterium]|nr:sugar phosphate isomerase/epimerase [Phycisphaerae bacterium]